MSFIERKIDVQIQLNGDTFDGSNDTLLLQGLRCQATVQSTVGGSTPFQSQAQVRILGMRGDDMAKLSTLGLVQGLYQRNLIAISAGDDDAGMAQIFSGQIFSGRVGYNNMPDVGVELVASATLAPQMSIVAGTSYKGSMDVATMLQAICSNSQPPMGFQNFGVKAALSNHAVGGSTWDQIKDICVASGIGWGIVDNTLMIYPKLGSRGDAVITLDANSGLVGYPEYSIRGIDVVSVFNPAIQFGRQMNITSAIPAPGSGAPLRADGTHPIGASGTFQIVDVVHDLAAQTPGGPWFTHAQLSSTNTVRTP